MMQLCNRFLGVALAVMVLALYPTFGQKKVNEEILVYSYRQIGTYRLIEYGPAEFKEVKELIVRFKKGVSPYNAKLNQDGKLETRGELSTTRQKYLFVNSVIGVEEKRLRSLTFESISVKGTSYRFEGRFPYPSRFDENLKRFIGLEGTLTKFSHGKKIAEAHIIFSRYAFE